MFYKIHIDNNHYGWMVILRKSAFRTCFLSFFFFIHLSILFIYLSTVKVLFQYTPRRSGPEPGRPRPQSLRGESIYHVLAGRCLFGSSAFLKLPGSSQVLYHCLRPKDSLALSFPESMVIGKVRPPSSVSCCLNSRDIIHRNFPPNMVTNHFAV